MAEDGKEMRSLALTPTWSVAVVLTVFVVVSLLVERGIHRLSSWLQRTNRKPLFEAVEKMKEEMMLLGFISLLLVATSSSISNICIKSKFYNSKFSPCNRSEVEDTEVENEFPKGRKLLMYSVFNPSIRRVLNGLHQNKCRKGYEPFVSFEGLEQLHRFIFVMAVTHVTYSCLTMLLAIVKRTRRKEQGAAPYSNDICSSFPYQLDEEGSSTLLDTPENLVEFNIMGCMKNLVEVLETYISVLVHTWRKWEDEAHIDRHDALNELTRELTRKTLKRQSTFVNSNASNPSSKNRLYVWLICFFRQFGHSVVHADYLTLRLGFITNHNLTLKYDFHSYMVRSMEEEFQKIVGVSGPLWGFVIAFMLFNIKGSNLYFWIAIIPITLVLVVGTKLQHVIATLALENAGIPGLNNGRMLRPRDDLFWFKKPELLLNLIHFILFQNAFELASFFWFWWQFGYRSCFISNHLLVYIRLILGFAGQFLCSYSTLPLYALVTQMGTNYKAALIPQRIRETIHGWKKSAKRKRRLGMINDDSTIHTDTSTVISLEDDEHHIYDISASDTCTEIELQTTYDATAPAAVTNGNSSQVGVPFLRASASLSYPHSSGDRQNMIARSSSMPDRR